MTFDLKIEFIGLCLFTRDVDANRLDVVLPATRPTETPWVPVLAFDRAYLSEDSMELTGNKMHVELRQATLDVDAGDVAPALPPEKVDLRALVGDAPLPDMRAAARIALRGGSLEQTTAPLWRFADAASAGSISTTTRWTCEYPGATLRLEGVPMDGAAASLSLPPLHPIDGSIHLRVVHLSAEEIPYAEPAGEPGEAADHFAAYYPLLENPQPPVTPPSES